MRSPMDNREGQEKSTPQWIRESKPQSTTVVATGIASDLVGAYAPEWLIARLESWREAIVGTALRSVAGGEPPRELFIVERENGEWITTSDGTDYSVFRSLSEAQEALHGEADAQDEAESLYKIVRFTEVAGGEPEQMVASCYDVGGDDLDPVTVQRRSKGWHYSNDQGKVIDGVEHWSVNRRGFVLNKLEEWEFEPIPSSRDEDFIQRTRWRSAKEAHAAYLALPAPPQGKEQK